MPLEMNREVFVTAAITGSGSTQDRSPHVPRSPEQIANSAIDAAKAGAAVVHCHVRDPETGVPSRKLDLYREVTDRIRAAEVDVVLNLTAGMGGDIVFGGVEKPFPTVDGTDLVGATERVAHVARMPAGDLYIRLRHDELCRGRLRHDQHPWCIGRDGAHDDRAWCQARDRSL